jgi:hypothetical protein
MSDENQTESGTAQPREIVANVDKNLDNKEMKFSFRTQEDPDTGVKTKRAPIEVVIPVLSIEGIIDVLQRGGKELELLQQAVENVYAEFAKSVVAEDSTITSDNFPFARITWAEIANQPEAERKGRGIAKEVWEDFYKDYLAIMPGVTGIAVKFIEKQVAIMSQKLNPLKNHEDKAKILPKFKDSLTVYLSASPNAESYAECVEFLVKKADTLLNLEQSADLAANLGF